MDVSIVDRNQSKTPKPWRWEEEHVPKEGCMSSDDWLSEMSVQTTMRVFFVADIIS